LSLPLQSIIANASPTHRRPHRHVAGARGRCTHQAPCLRAPTRCWISFPAFFPAHRHGRLCDRRRRAVFSIPPVAHRERSNGPEGRAL